MKKKWILAAILGTLLLTVGACAKEKDSGAAKKEQLTVGVVSGAEEDVWKDIAKRLEAENIELTVKRFDDYNQPNIAASSGDIDFNGTQHLAYMENYNQNIKNNDEKLVSIGYTYVSPLGIYSSKYKKTEDIPSGATITIPNDPTNGGRALRLLAQLNFIELDDSKESPTTSDITKNVKKIKFTELDASQTARTINDVDAAIINTNFALDAGLDPYKDALYTDIKKVADYYKNVIATRESQKDNKTYLKVVKTYQTDATEKLLKKITDGADVPAWK